MEQTLLEILNECDELADPEWHERVLTDMLRDFCVGKGFELSAEETALLEERDLLKTVEIWKDLYSEKDYKKYPGDTQIVLK